jgi:hypothetical protein
MLSRRDEKFEQGRLVHGPAKVRELFVVVVTGQECDPRDGDSKILILFDVPSSLIKSRNISHSPT